MMSLQGYYTIKGIAIASHRGLESTVVSFVDDDFIPVWFLLFFVRDVHEQIF